MEDKNGREMEIRSLGLDNKKLQTRTYNTAELQNCSKGWQWSEETSCRNLGVSDFEVAK